MIMLNDLLCFALPFSVCSFPVLVCAWLCLALLDGDKDEEDEDEHERDDDEDDEDDEDEDD